MKNVIRITILLAITIFTNSFALHAETNSNPRAIHVETVGQGQPVIYLPGFATPGAIWKDTVNNLNLQTTSYLVSYAGFNGNAPIEMPWYATIKTALVDYIKDQNLSDVIIIGHSMGGNLAVDIAAELPNTISKIIIVEALPCMREVMMPNVPVESFQYDSPYNQQMLTMDATQFNSMATMMASNMTMNENKKETIANWILEADRKTWVYGYTDLLKLDLRSQLNQVTCESLILGASFPDVEVAKANYISQYENLPNKTLKMAPDSKHFLMFDQPEWFYATVNEFLADEKK